MAATAPAAAPAAAAGLVFCHGSGDSGDGVRQWLDHASAGIWSRSMASAGVKVVYPSAPAIPYTLAGGFPQTVWFDRSRMAYDAPEDAEGLSRSVEQVDAEIDKLLASGIPIGRIGVAGFSMGACLALHVAYGNGRHAGKLAAAASMSTFLAQGSVLDASAAAKFQGAEPMPAAPLYMAHGTLDAMIQPAWAEATRKRLLKLGIPAPEELIMFSMGHDMCNEELAQVTTFLLKHLSEPAT